ncbi:MAG: DNA translocase FtsK 4TM domain-containing protein [Gemmatimonadetes bacterium]|nr:DNA translocase FtsK 4TM domain-containing protein [Gemmatimonadota bacterium]
MPKPKSRRPRPAPDLPPEPSPEALVKLERHARLKNEVLGIALLLGSLFVTGSLLAGGSADGESCTNTASIFGPVGSCMRGAMLMILGAIAAAIVPMIPAVHALKLLGRIPANEDQRWLFFTIGLTVIIPVTAALAGGATLDPSNIDILAGFTGSFVAFYLVKAIGLGGAWVLVAIGLSGLAAATLAWNPIRLLLGNRSAKVHPDLTSAKDPELLSAIGAALGTLSPREQKGMTKAEALEPSAAEMPALDLSLFEGAGSTTVSEDAPPEDAVSADLPDGESANLRGSAVRTSKGKKQSKADKHAAHEAAVAAAIASASDPTEAMGEELPPLDLLSLSPPKNADGRAQSLDLMGQKLMDALRTFKVEGLLTGRTSGPTVTQYEIEPAPGVKVRQFANLANDLALAMRAPSIRIVAPIPGKGAVGVEVPNPTPEIVNFRAMLESREYQSSPRALPIALGRDLEGKPVIADLAKMPHLLIAGATGSGKSVCVNTIITSLIYRHTPKTLRFLMVDPKMVELSVYNVLPHQRHKVVTDNRDAAALLKWAVLEMHDRYQLLAANGSRNIQDFNQKVRNGASLRKPKDPNFGVEDMTYAAGVLPYIVVVIDELADLMMTCAAEVETPLAMLAQKARAIGIHLLLATQRPSVNVITGLIKANFPSRIAFRVASQIDSRTILDGMGAESLLGNGDMLFIPPGKSEPARLQGAFLPNEDTERLMKWYSDRRETRKAAMEAHGMIVPEHVASEDDVIARVRAREALEAGARDDLDRDDLDRDKLFREAAEVCVQNQGGSTSLLQRRLRIGYGRAARVIDQLHMAGILGPPDGSKPRDVLVGLDDLDRICGTAESAAA